MEKFLWPASWVFINMIFQMLELHSFSKAVSKIKMMHTYHSFRFHHNHSDIFLKFSISDLH